MEPIRIRRELQRRDRRRRRLAIALVGGGLSLGLIWLAGWNTQAPRATPPGPARSRRPPTPRPPPGT